MLSLSKFLMVNAFKSFLLRILQLQLLFGRTFRDAEHPEMQVYSTLIDQQS